MTAVPSVGSCHTTWNTAQGAGSPTTPSTPDYPPVPLLPPVSPTTPSTPTTPSIPYYPPPVCTVDDPPPLQGFRHRFPNKGRTALHTRSAPAQGPPSRSITAAVCLLVARGGWSFAAVPLRASFGCWPIPPSLPSLPASGPCRPLLPDAAFLLLGPAPSGRLRVHFALWLSPHPLFREDSKNQRFRVGDHPSRIACDADGDTGMAAVFCADSTLKDRRHRRSSRRQSAVRHNCDTAHWRDTPNGCGRDENPEAAFKKHAGAESTTSKLQGHAIFRYLGEYRRD